MFKLLVHGLSDLLYPPNCILCKQSLRPLTNHLPQQLCWDCFGTIEFNRPPFCTRCSRQLSSLDQPLCRDCQTIAYHFDLAWGACFYNETMRRLIHHFKYGGKTLLRHTFKTIIDEFISTYQIDFKSFDLIVPIPLHSTRQRERGFNQTQLLTEDLAKTLNLPVSSYNLLRQRFTPNQAAIPPKERFTNIKGAFTIKNSFEFFQKSVLLVDDLMTTGMTASEAALILKETGARHVGVLTLAIVH